MFAELYIPSFDDFWNAYDKKVGRNYCEKKWNRIKEDKNKILDHVIQYVKSTPNKQYRKNPETYLNNECWNDEIIMPLASHSKITVAPDPNEDF